MPDRIYSIDRKPKTIKCEKCGKRAKEIISCGNSAYLGNQNPTWMDSTLEVIDRHGGEHCKRVHKEKTRDALNNWMKVEGRRFKEPGEKAKRPASTDNKKMAEMLYERHRKRTAVEIG